MPKFFINQKDINNSVVELCGENANHIANVLRLKIGDTIEVCANDSIDIIDYTCEIINIKDNTVIAEVIERLESASEPNIKIILYQGLPKAEKMELIIQKGVELGINSIVPISTERAIVKLSKGDKQDKKIGRWNKISESASKQSKRSIIPAIKSVLTFKEAIQEAVLENSVNIIPYELEEEFSLKEFCEEVKAKYLSNSLDDDDDDNNSVDISIGVFIGPEGGFTEKEIHTAINNKVIPITLGKRILRTETAGFITTAILLHELDNY